MKNTRKVMWILNHLHRLMMNILLKLSTGRVLGMVDQWWNFAYNVNDSLKQQGLDEKGCSYVPLPITIDEGIKISGTIQEEL